MYILVHKLYFYFVYNMNETIFLKFLGCVDFLQVSWVDVDMFNTKCENIRILGLQISITVLWGGNGKVHKIFILQLKMSNIYSKFSLNTLKKGWVIDKADLKDNESK